jgi:WD40 repeat protein
LSALDGARAASADVVVDGSRRGTAVLVGHGFLLTAGHVIGDDAPNREIRVRFPPSEEELEVTVVDLSAYSGDLAVLELVDRGVLHPQLPPPLDVWANDRLPAVVSAYGFPRVEKRSEGVWRSFSVSGSTSSGTHQLRWDEGAGSFVGQSGGPVVDARTGALVGILLAGSDSGRFTRFLAVPEIARVWPALPRPWCLDRGDRALVTRVAHGRRSSAQGGDLFRGRARALRAVKDWLAQDAAGSPLVITGQPGSGKSAVLGRAALEAERAGGRGLVFLARQAAVLDLLEAIAAFLDLPTPTTVDYLVEEVQKLSPDDVTLMVDGVDEARTPADARQMAETLTELARLRFFRVAVATRPLAAGNRFQPDGLLHRLLAQDAGSPNLVDLDAHPYDDGPALVEFSAAMLAQEGATSPAPAGAAWEGYRRDEGMRLRLARVIADRARPNFLVAGITALSLSQSEGVLDPNSAGFDPQGIPANLTEALQKYYTALPDEMARRKAKSLLAALAYALGPGISDDRWLSFATALGYNASRADLDSFRDSPGVDYLIQTEDDAGDHVVRLFHPALVEQLRRGRQESDWLKVFTVLRNDVKAAGGWSRADAYVRTYVAEHAAACKKISVLLQDVDFLKFTDMGTLVSTLRSSEPDDYLDLATVIAQEGPRLQQLAARERLWLLATSALHGGLFDVRDDLLGGESWVLEPVWAHPLSSSYQKLTGKSGPIHVWSPRRGDLFGALVGHTGRITSLALGVVDGEDVIVSGSADRTVQVWTRYGELAGGAFRGHSRPVILVFTTTFANQSAIVSAAAGGEVYVRNPEGYMLQRFPVSERLLAAGSVKGEDVVLGVNDDWLSEYSLSQGHRRAVPIDEGRKTALSAGRIRQTDVVACGLDDGSVAVWRLVDGSPYRASLPPTARPVQSLSLHRVDATDIIMVLRSDSSLGVWNPRVGLTEPWKGHPRTASVAAMGSLGTREVAACAGDDGVVRLWDGRTLLNSSRSNTREPFEHLAVAVVAGDLTAATVSGTRISLWDAEGNLAPLQPPEHDSPVSALALGALPDGPVLVSVCRDMRVHLWNPLDGSLRTAESGHGKPVTSIALGDEDWPFLVTRSADGTLRILDQDGSEVSRIPILRGKGPHTAWPCALGGRRSLVVAQSDYVVRVWDCEDGTWSHTLPPTGHIGTAYCTMLSVDGHEVLAFGCADGHIRTWRPGQSQYRVSLQRHDGRIWGLGQTTIGGQPALVTAGSEGTLRLWLDMERCEVFVLSEPARMACEGDEIVLATGPALSRLKVGAVMPTLTPQRTEEYRTAFFSDQELPFDVAAESARSDVLRPRLRSSVTNEMKSARAIARVGLHGEAVVQLLPHHSGHPAAVCLAADVAFQSRDADLIDYVLPHLMSAPVRGLVSVQARLLALALLTDRDDLAASTVPTLMRTPQEVCVELIRLFDTGDAEDEWRVYERGSELQGGSPVEVLADLCAARLLAMCRRGSRVAPEEFNRLCARLLEEYWELFDLGDRRSRLADLLTSYPMPLPDSFRLVAYQAVSIYHTLAAEDPATAEALRPRLTQEISSALQAETARRQQEFAQWAPLSSLAADVVRASGP